MSITEAVPDVPVPEFTLRLTLPELATVMNLLARGAYADVADLILKLNQQITPQIADFNQRAALAAAPAPVVTN